MFVALTLIPHQIEDYGVGLPIRRAKTKTKKAANPTVVEDNAQNQQEEKQ